MARGTLAEDRVPVSTPDGSQSAGNQLRKGQRSPRVRPEGVGADTGRSSEKRHRAPASKEPGPRLSCQGPHGMGNRWAATGLMEAQGLP